MSSDSQAIFFFIAFIGCVLAGLWGYLDPAKRPIAGLHPGWFGLASFAFVFFYNAMKAS